MNTAYSNIPTGFEIWRNRVLPAGSFFKSPKHICHGLPSDHPQIDPLGSAG